MVRSLLTTVTSLLVLVAAIGGAWFVSERAQRADQRSEYAACWSSAKSTERIDCVSDRLLQEAGSRASGRSGQARGEAIAAFVRDRERAAADDAELAAVCHPAMHELGRTEGRTVAREAGLPVFPAGSSQLCTAGYVHGLAEGYLVATPDAEVMAVFPKLCHDADVREGCAHGVGHALVRARSDDGAAAAAAGASRACGELPDELATNCRNGVYMELAIRTDPVVAVDEFIDTCRSIAAVDERLTCWGYLSSAMATNDVPLERVPAACARADLPGQFTCVEQYGRSLGALRVDQCEGSSTRFEVRARCVGGALGVHVGSGHVSESEARDACLAIDEGRLERRCLTSVGRFASGRRDVEAGR